MHSSDDVRRYLYFVIQQLLDCHAKKQIVHHDPPAREVITDVPETWNLPAALAILDYKRAHDGALPEDVDATCKSVVPVFLEPLGITSSASVFAFHLALMQSTLAMLYRTNYLVMDYLGKCVQDKLDYMYNQMDVNPDASSVSGIRGVYTLPNAGRDGIGYAEDRNRNRGRDTQVKRVLQHPRMPASASFAPDNLFDFSLIDTNARLFIAVLPYVTYMPPPMRVRDPEPAAPSDKYDIFATIHVWRGNYNIALALLTAFDFFHPPTTPVPDYFTWLYAEPRATVPHRIFDFQLLQQNNDYWPDAWADLAQNQGVRASFFHAITSAYKNDLAKFNIHLLFYKYVYLFYWPRMQARLAEVTGFPLRAYIQPLLSMPNYQTLCTKYLPYIPEDGPYLPDDAAVALQQIFSYQTFSLLLELD